MKFYMGYSREVPDTIPAWAADVGAGLLSNATQRWSEKQGRFLPMWEYDADHVVDAGGFNVLARWVRERVDVTGAITVEDSLRAVEADPEGHAAELQKPAPFYPWTVQEYHEWLHEHRGEYEWACVMDYACEERFDPVFGKQARMEATLSNTVEHFRKSPKYPLIPVLQGRSLDGYLWSYDRLLANLIPIGKVGLGTVCRIASESKIVDLERSLRRETDVGHFHGFGVKIDAYKMGATFDTADSAAWIQAPRKCMKYIPTGNGSLEKVPCDDYRERSTESFKNYYRHVEKIANGGY